MTKKLLTPQQQETYDVYKEVSTPATPATGYVAVYAKSDGKMYRKDDTGTEAELGGSSVSGISNGLLQMIRLGAAF